jgi:hypothetical protein
VHSFHQHTLKHFTKTSLKNCNSIILFFYLPPYLKLLQTVSLAVNWPYTYSNILLGFRLRTFSNILLGFRLRTFSIILLGFRLRTFSNILLGLRLRFFFVPERVDVSWRVGQDSKKLFNSTD